MRIRSPRRSGALEGNRENIGRLAGDFAEPTSFDRRRLCSRMELPGARGSESLAEITRRIRSSERCDTSSGPFCELPFRTRRVRGRFTAPLRPRTRATRPCRHVRSRCTETTEPRGVCGRARTVAWRASCAPRNDYRSASSLAGHPCLDHRRSRRNREYRTPRVGRSHFGGGGSGSRSAVPTYPQPPHKWTTSPDSGRTGGSLRASRIASPHWGHKGAVSGSFRTSMLGNQCGEHFRPRRSTGQYCSLTCRKASARFRTVSVPQLRNGGVDDIAHYRLPQPLVVFA